MSADSRVYGNYYGTVNKSVEQPWLPGRLGDAQALVMINPGFGLYTGLEPEDSLADTITALDRYIKARSVNCWYNRVNGHADFSWQAQCADRNNQGEPGYRCDHI
jgi:hypothetical protein